MLSKLTPRRSTVNVLVLRKGLRAEKGVITEK